MTVVIILTLIISLNMQIWDSILVLYLHVVYGINVVKINLNGLKLERINLVNVLD